MGLFGGIVKLATNIFGKKEDKKAQAAAERARVEAAENRRKLEQLQLQIKQEELERARQAAQAKQKGPPVWLWIAGAAAVFLGLLGFSGAFSGKRRR